MCCLFSFMFMQRINFWGLLYGIHFSMKQRLSLAILNGLWPILPVDRVLRAFVLLFVEPPCTYCWIDHNRLNFTQFGFVSENYFEHILVLTYSFLCLRTSTWLHMLVSRHAPCVVHATLIVGSFQIIGFLNVAYSFMNFPYFLERGWESWDWKSHESNIMNASRNIKKGKGYSNQVVNPMYVWQFVHVMWRKR